MSTKQQINQIKFSMKEQQCLNVVVYSDRAELKRLVKTKLKKGENELIFTSISGSIDQDSVRVDGRGAATVLDVVCQSRSVESDNVDNRSEKENELKSEIKNLESNIEKVEAKLDRVTKQTNVLNEFANTLSKPGVSGGRGSDQNDSNNADASLVRKENVDLFMTFLDTYSDKLEELDAKKSDLSKELTTLNEQLQVSRQNLNQIVHLFHNQAIEITILLESEKDDNEVELTVSYVVFGAHWTPKYDIRVSNTDKSMIINYFGMITQSTGEDWNDVKISLSTAMPAVGGNVPELGTQNVAIKLVQPSPPTPMSNVRFNSIKSHTENFRGIVMAAATTAMDMVPISFQTTQVKESSVGSTSNYDIPRNGTIPSDSNPHKVTIGIINLTPEFEYETVPKMATYAFLKAKVTNTSEYSLLAGPANVFLDNNFIAKTDLKSYSPQEEFFCSLGVDPAIRIDYKPVKKFKAHSGLLSKTTTTTYHQVIEIKNTTSLTAKVLVIDQLPLSNDDKINVKLLEPNMKANANVKLNKSNNLEFDLNLAANKTEEVTIKYSIDHPSDKEVEFF